MVARTPEARDHDLDHAANHIREVGEHARKLRDVLARNPDIAAEDKLLADVTREMDDETWRYGERAWMRKG